ncbi:hypothetical protein POX_b02173 [Penicillium oxalicum]|uniref:Uncharacterized protein n=1 Tax=Penicillium oxalicum (strain 114-2 / CGMCC 5302) TaxID=933388 RepID=S8B7Y5_PENO1|nr:hypothetical protein POX_b02173 [Penicillium oxalicum]EPS30827.1 hypothetical protein PDE_05779 [Penicillium oxalicum 114-2]KAI2792137.1 hypothetical protein POX_b02173 [Penicillium oxalicum]
MPSLTNLVVPGNLGPVFGTADLSTKHEQSHLSRLEGDPDLTIGKGFAGRTASLQATKLPEPERALMWEDGKRDDRHVWNAAPSMGRLGFCANAPDHFL